MHSHIDFGYPAYIVYGHLLITALALPVLVVAWLRKWSWWILAPAALLVAWSLSAFLMVRFGLDFNGRMDLPTESFLSEAASAGKPVRVLDMGAGSGRSAIMTLEARPNTTLVALDLFGAEYDAHFGTDRKTQDTAGIGREKLLTNFRLAALETRTSVQAGDMRKMPLEDASFDAIVSAYAIDHLNTKGIEQSLSEAARVLKPRGEFLLMVVSKDAWVNYLWGPLFMHRAMRPAARWAELLNAAGFDVAEQGSKPATLYFLARKR